MYKNAAHKQGAKHIRCILCNKKQSVQQITKQRQNHDRAKNPQFFTNNGKYHVILCLRHTSKLLNTVSKTSAKETS